MEKIQENINRFLPFGESLRSILQHDSIKDKERRQLLRMKGVFMNTVDEDSSFPILTTSLLSPLEFDFVKERLQAREDREKTITRTIDWESDNTLISSIPDDLKIQEIAKTQFPRYQVIGNPNFTMIDRNPDKIRLEFKCETNSYSKAWFRGKNEFKGQIVLEKLKESKKVHLQIVHTSPETTEIADKVTRKLEKHFKEIKCMGINKEVEKILCKDFTNEERIEFFLSMTEGNHVFSFDKATFLDIGPDPNGNLPDEISWLELAKVRELNINGEVLHNIPFLKVKEFQKFIELAEMEIIYNFSLPSHSGNCRIRFGFTNYLKSHDGNIEFIVDIVKVNLNGESLNSSLSSVKTELSKEFEKFKSEKYVFCKRRMMGLSKVA